MSSQIIPKQQLSAHQRWELNSFDLPRARGETADVALPTADQLERIQRQAHEEGFAAGYQEGRLKAQAEAQRLQQLLDGLAQELLQFDQHLTQDLLTLALDIARQMLLQALKVRPELVLPVVREALDCLPQFNQHAHLVLHPEDALLVRAHMGDQLAHSGWKIVEDGQVERGGCRMETAHSQVDATPASRWQRIVAALGRDHGWLE